MSKVQNKLTTPNKVGRPVGSSPNAKKSATMDVDGETTANESDDTDSDANDPSTDRQVKTHIQALTHGLTSLSCLSGVIYPEVRTWSLERDGILQKDNALHSIDPDVPSADQKDRRDC
jgi:hypothetical protein